MTIDPPDFSHTRGFNALSINHTTLFIAAARDVACPDLMVFSSR